MSTTKDFVVIHDLGNDTEWQIVRKKATVQDAIDEAGYRILSGDVLYVFEIGEIFERFEGVARTEYEWVKSG